MRRAYWKVEGLNSYRKISKDVGLVGVAQVASSIKGLILLPILAKTLGVEDYGIWAQISVTIGLLMPIAILQLGIAMTRFLAAEKDNEKISKGVFSILTTVFFTALVIFFFLFIFAEPIAATVFGGVGATSIVRLAAALTLWTALDQIIIEYFIAFRQMERYAVFSIFRTIGEIVLIGYLVLSGYGILGAVISLMAVSVIFFVAGFLIIGREIGLSKPSYALIKQYLIFSLPLFPTTLCIWIVNLSDRYIIGFFMNMDAVGIYSTAYGLGSLVALFFFPISTLLLPTITNLYEKNNIQELKMYLKYSLKSYLMLAIPCLFGISVISKSLLSTLTTSEFVSGYLIVPIIMLATILFNCSSIGMNVIIFHKKTKSVGLIYSISATINIVMNIVLIPKIGILGAAIATLTAFSLHLIMVSVISARYFSFDIDSRFIQKSIVSSGFMGLILLELNSIFTINILILISVGMIIYFVSLVTLRAFSDDEYKLARDFLIRSAVSIKLK